MRAADRPANRKPFFVYVDEPTALGDIPVPLDGLFEGVVLAAGQMRSVEGNGLAHALLPAERLATDD